MRSIQKNLARNMNHAKINTEKKIKQIRKKVTNKRGYNKNFFKI